MQAYTNGTSSQVSRFELYKQGTDESCFIELYSLPVQSVFKLLVIHDSPLFNSPDVTVLYGDLGTLNEQADKSFYAYQAQGYVAPKSTYCGQTIN